MGDDEEGFVKYGEPFDDRDNDRTFQGQRVKPQAYEQRVLNEKGRPQRFHGAFTGGFSAGYFNSVGSKEGFKPQSFISSRKNREQNANQSKDAQPEDFMDEEDLGEFGIAPRRYRTRQEYDDNHIFDTLSKSLGGKSVIPVANDILKRMLIPSGTSLAERLLRRMGWKGENNDDQATVEKQNDDDKIVTKSDDVSHPMTVLKNPNDLEYAVISFAPKSNSFGLGYSGLDPEIALGRKAATSRRDPQQESVSALQSRQQKSQNNPAFNPTMDISRDGIRGQAFGVGALHTEDADIYATDNMASYDFSIGGEQENDKYEDDEMAELEAARCGRLSDWHKEKKSSIKRPRKEETGGRTIDGWTAPSNSRVSLSGEESSCVLPGFVAPHHSDAALVISKSDFFVLPKPVSLPPGYSPIFHPTCLHTPSSIGNKRPVRAEEKGGMQRESFTGSVFELLNREDKQKLETVSHLPPLTSFQSTTSIFKSQNSQNILPPPMPPTLGPMPLLKPFLSDPAKQARFESYQVLCRRGFAPEDAYSRCSSESKNLSSETRKREADSFNAILNINLSIPPPAFASTASHDQSKDPISLTFGRLDPEKQKLVSNLLKSRFRSVGEMDVTNELSVAQEEERRKQLDTLDMTDPRDNAAANDSYGVLTHRRLAWHPAALLCKRVNVPNPYPDSTFLGCPDDRRHHKVPRLRRGRDKTREDSSFSLFQLLDVNIGSTQPNPEDDDFSSDEEEEEKEVLKSVVKEEFCLKSLPPPPAYSLAAADNVGAPSIFDALFAASNARQNNKNTELISDPLTVEPASQASKNVGIVYAAAPPPTNNGITEDPAPSIDLFKSIFASDEELESSDDEKESVSESQTSFIPRPGVHEFSLLSRDKMDDHEEDTFDLRSPAVTEDNGINAPAADLSVHQLFKHLFNPGLDSEAPLFAVSSVAQEKRTGGCKDKPMETLPPRSHSIDDENNADSYGPLLPPDFVPSSEGLLTSGYHTFEKSSREHHKKSKNHRESSHRGKREHKHKHKHKNKQKQGE